MMISSVFFNLVPLISPIIFNDRANMNNSESRHYFLM